MRKKEPKNKVETKKRNTLTTDGLANAKEASSYLEQAFKDGPEIFLPALGQVVAACGGTNKLSKKSGLSSKSLIKLLSGDSHATLPSVAAVLSASGIRVHFLVKSSKRKSLSDTSITSAKELKFSKTTIKKLTALNKPKANIRRPKTSSKNSSKKRN